MQGFLQNCGGGSDNIVFLNMLHVHVDMYSSRETLKEGFHTGFFGRGKEVCGALQCHA